MNTSIRDKNNKYRSEIRKQFLQEYFKQRREELLNSQTTEEERAVNQEAKEPLLQSDILRLYEMFYINQGIKKLSLLNKQNCIKLFYVLASNLTEIECILLLHSFFDRHYQAIFLNKQQQAYNRQFVNHLYQAFYKTIQEYRLQQNQSNRSFLKSKLGGYLNCIKSLMMMKEQFVGENGFMFDQVCNHGFLKDLWRAIDVLIDSPIYLTVLILAQIELDFTTTMDFQAYLEGNRHVFVQLIEQIVPQKKLHAPLSLYVVNSIMKNITQKRQLVFSLLPLYISKLKLVYSRAQDIGKDRMFKFGNFREMIENVCAIFELFEREILTVHLGELFSQNNLWTLLILILRIETPYARGKAYSLINSTFKNMMVNHARLQAYIDPAFFPLVSEGLQMQFLKMITDSLQILQCLLIYEKNNQREDFSFVKQLINYDIEINLENLAHSKNKEIGQKAGEMRDLFQEIQKSKGQMAIE